MLRTSSRSPSCSTSSSSLSREPDSSPSPSSCRTGVLHLIGALQSSSPSPELLHWWRLFAGGSSITTLRTRLYTHVPNYCKVFIGGRRGISEWTVKAAPTNLLVEWTGSPGFSAQCGNLFPPLCRSAQECMNIASHWNRITWMSSCRYNWCQQPVESSVLYKQHVHVTRYCYWRSKSNCYLISLQTTQDHTRWNAAKGGWGWNTCALLALLISLTWETEDWSLILTENQWTDRIDRSWLHKWLKDDCVITGSNTNCLVHYNSPEGKTWLHWSDSCATCYRQDPKQGRTVCEHIWQTKPPLCGWGVLLCVSVCVRVWVNAWVCVCVYYVVLF